MSEEIKPIFAGWPSGDVLRLHDGYREHGIVVLRREDWKHCKQQMAQLENLKADVEREMMPSGTDDASEGPSGANETGFVPPVCPTHKVQMVLSFYRRGHNDPPGNGWSCLVCGEERKTEPAESKPAESKPLTGPHWEVAKIYAEQGCHRDACILDLRKQVERQNERIERLEEKR